MYPHPEPGKKFSLKYLAKKYLKKIIQNNEKTGHDSIEDAITTLELVHLKIQKETTEHDHIEHDQTWSLLQILEKYGRKVHMMAKQEVLNKFAAGTLHSLPCSSDIQKVAQAKSLLHKKNDLLIIHMEDILSNFDSTPDSPEMANVIGQASDSLSELYESSPLNTMFIVISGQSSSKKIKRMEELKIKAQQSKSWSNKHNQYLEFLKIQARTGILFVGVKKEEQKKQDKIHPQV